MDKFLFKCIDLGLVIKKIDIDPENEENGNGRQT